MKNYLLKITACIGLVLISVSAFSWGQKGHDIVCAIAEKHLDKCAKKKITKILDGKSIVYWANWMDNASHTPEYEYTKSWHYSNIDADETYDNAAVNPKGNVVTAIEKQISDIKSGTLTKEQEALALKMLVHFVGDIHAPMHMGHKSDLGGNKVQLRYFGRGKNLHGIWDTDILEDSHKWSHTEWVKQIDRYNRKEIKKIASGTISDWGRETYQLCTSIYDSTPSGAKLSYDYVAKWAPTIEYRLAVAGIRLASILNELY